MSAWQERAACRGMDTDLFFPARGESPEPVRAVCAGCPVRLQCLDDAMAHGELFGMWGGLSGRERRRLRQRRPAA